MKTLFGSPRLSAALCVGWLLLQNSIDPGQVTLAVMLALAIPLLLRPLTAARLRPGKPFTLLRLAVVVAWDVVVSNLEVARRILGPEAAIRPGFVWVPLDLRDPGALTLLAGIVTMTPGTVSADVSEDGRHLLVHALHVTDPAALAGSIKRRYEAPLLEVFP